MDDSRVKKLFIFKSGYFSFSQNFSCEKLSNLLIESSVLFRTINDLPILPSLATNLQEELIRRSIFGTAALEGNPLTEEKVGEIIANPAGIKTKDRAEIEIRNLKTAYDLIKNLEPVEKFKLNEDLIKNIHALITMDVKHNTNEPGHYRSHPVKVGDTEHGDIYTPPKCFDDIKNLMQEFIAWINSEEIIDLLPPIRAALGHYHFALIHPFSDGNGRTARIIEAMLLRASGIRYAPVMLSNYYYLNMDDYFKSFSLTTNNADNDVTRFLEFVLKGLVHSLNEIKERITYFIRKFTLRDYYGFLKKGGKLTQRQHDLLVMLLELTNKKITLKDLTNSAPFNVLYRNVSQRTARRDFEKMCDSKLLTESAGKQYELNLRALELSKY